MKTIIISLFLFFSPFTYQQEIDINALRKDPVMIQYKKVMKESMEAIENNRYKLPKDKSYQKEISANPTKENMIKVLKKNGVVNAEEYVESIFLQTTLMFSFLKKHPELSKLDPKKKSEIISKLIFD